MGLLVVIYMVKLATHEKDTDKEVTTGRWAKNRLAQDRTSFRPAEDMKQAGDDDDAIGWCSNCQMSAVVNVHLEK